MYLSFFFFFNDTATTEIYTLSLHDALPIYLELTENMKEGHKKGTLLWVLDKTATAMGARRLRKWIEQPLISKDRKSTRLNSSHANISYAVFCLKKKRKAKTRIQ